MPPTDAMRSSVSAAGTIRPEPLRRSHRHGGQEDADHEAGDQVGTERDSARSSPALEEGSVCGCPKHRHDQQARDGDLNGE